MRKAKGIVKVRAMRISEDGTRFREFAWAQNDDKDHEQRPIRGTITLSLHLCHFAEATVDVTPSTNSQSPDKSNMTGDNGLHNDQMSHPVLAPPTTRPHGSKLWTWYWRDEEPRAMFHFTYATKEALQAEGIIPLTSKRILEYSTSPIQYEPEYADIPFFPARSTGNLAVEATAPVAVARSSALRTHKPQMSHGSLSAFSPRDLIKRKQSISVVTRQRGYSTSSSDSSVSSISEASSVDSDGGSAQSVDLESESDIDEGHGTVGGNEHKAGKAKSTEMICE